MASKPKRNGRPRLAKGPVRNFRFSPAADKAILAIAKPRGWTRTLAVERALLFASVHPEFNGGVR